MLTRIASGAVLLSLLGLAACSASGDSAGSSEANDTSATATAPVLGVIKGRELARCWFDVVGADAQLSCTTTARGNDPLSMYVAASVIGKIGGPEGLFEKLDVNGDGGSRVVGTLPMSSFPRQVYLEALIGLNDTSILGTPTNEWSVRLESADPSKITAANPIVITEPFDFWQVGVMLDVSNVSGFGLTAQPYTADFSRYSIGYTEEHSGGTGAASSIVFAPELTVTAGKIRAIVAPQTPGPLPLTYQRDAQKIDTSIAGPGYYVLTNEGVRPATADEINATFASQPPSGPTNNGSTADAGATPAPTDTADAGPATTTPDPAPVDPDPTCGGDGQARCSKADIAACDPGTRNYGGICSTCGADGQPTCYVDPNGDTSAQGLKCDAGTRNSGGICSTCGGNGQQACYADPNGATSAQGLKCDAGTRNNSGYCSTCGGNGQQACYADPNGATSAQGLKCNDGLRNNGGYCAQ